MKVKKTSGQQDSNLRPPGPKLGLVASRQSRIRRNPLETLHLLQPIALPRPIRY